MKPGDTVRSLVPLGGWAREECAGRPLDDVVLEGAVGTVVRYADWMDGGPLAEPGVWWVVRFEREGEADMYVPAADGHVEVLS